MLRDHPNGFIQPVDIHYFMKFAETACAFPHNRIPAQFRISFAWVMLGWRWVGSSLGRL